MFLRLSFTKRQKVFIEYLLYSPGIALPTRSKYNNSWCFPPPFPSDLIAVDLLWHAMGSAGVRGIHAILEDLKGLKTKGEKKSLLKWYHHIIIRFWNVLFARSQCFLFQLGFGGSHSTNSRGRTKSLFPMALSSCFCLEPPFLKCLHGPNQSVLW